MFDAVRCRDAIAVSAHGECGFKYIKNVNARHAPSDHDRTRRSGTPATTSTTGSALRAGQARSSMPHAGRTPACGRASAVGLRGVRPENGKPIILSF